MCTLVILRRPGHPWPLILAANRDEMTDRPWLAPGRHWPDRPEVVAGRDETAGGSWLGLNDHGVVAGVLNRVDSLGPEPGKRSRGELVLEALDHADAATAANNLARLDPAAYRSFNLVIADNRDAFWLRSSGWPGNSGPGADGGAAGAPAGGRNAPRVEAFEIPAGTSMVTAHDRNDPASSRIQAYLPQFEAAGPPDPKAGDWASWAGLMKARTPGGSEDPYAAMTIVTSRGFGTVSSSLIALPGPPRTLRTRPNRPVWQFAPGRPDQVSYENVEI
jgi:hypothetical protein